MTPRVTVAVPIYNGESHLGACIESVLGQTLDDHEVLLVDDASDDGSVAVARSFDDPRIRVVVNEQRLGAAGNWNECLRLSRAPYVKVLSHDDVIHPTCLARQVEVLDADPELMFVTARRDIVDDVGRVLVANRGLNGLSGRFDAATGIPRLIRSGTNIFGEGAAVLLRRDRALEIGGFDPEVGYVLDLDMWARLLLEGPAHAIDETLADYRIRQGQWSMALATRQASSVKACFTRLAADPRASVGRFDRWMGSAKASILARVRRVVYVWLRLRGR